MIVVTAAGGSTGAAVVRGAAVAGAAGARPGGQRAAPAGAHRARGRGRRRRPQPARRRSTPLLAGADALYLIWPNFDPGEAAGAAALLAAARRCRHAPRGLPLGAAAVRPARCRTTPRRTASRRRWTRSGLAWRVLQPCAYADNLDGRARRGRRDRPVPESVGSGAGAVAGRPARRRRRRGGAAHRGRSGRRHVRGGRAGAADRPADRRTAVGPARPAGHGGGRRARRTGATRRRLARASTPRTACGGCSTTTGRTASPAARGCSRRCWAGRPRTFAGHLRDQANSAGRPEPRNGELR